MARPRLHLVSPAGAARPFLDVLKLSSTAELLALVSHAVGPAYEITGNSALIEATEDEHHGGRADDAARASDITEALADDHTAAIMFVRGGAWFTRVLPHIDFTALDRRTRPVAVFGFSEATTLVNIVGAHPMGRGIYDMGPAFLTYGLRRHAVLRARFDGPDAPRPEDWMRSRMRPEFVAYFEDVRRIMDGAGTQRTVRAKLVRDALPRDEPAVFVGGNLTVLSTLVGSMFDQTVRPVGRWLVLEDFNDKIERLDRFLAHLTLARYWDRCAGVLLGDFHRGYDDLTPAVLELLRYHVPADDRLPVLTTGDVGHIWPMAPLPLHTPVRFLRIGDDEFNMEWPSAAMRTAWNPL